MRNRQNARSLLWYIMLNLPYKAWPLKLMLELKSRLSDVSSSTKASGAHLLIAHMPLKWLKTQVQMKTEHKTCNMVRTVTVNQIAQWKEGWNHNTKDDVLSTHMLSLPNAVHIEPTWAYKIQDSRWQRLLATVTANSANFEPMWASASYHDYYGDVYVAIYCPEVSHITGGLVELVITSTSYPSLATVSVSTYV